MNVPVDGSSRPGGAAPHRPMSLPVVGASDAGIGFVPFAPGTFGSSPGVALALGLRQVGPWWAEGAALVLLFIAGVWAANAAETHFGRIDPVLPPALAQVRAKLKQHADGDQQFVKVLGAVLAHGLSAVEAACAEALAAGIASGDVILTVLARRHQPPTPASITTPDGLRLKVEPVADCGRYDSIRKVA